jgi:N-acyl-D-amino-acid deacylase
MIRDTLWLWLAALVTAVTVGAAPLATEPLLIRGGTLVDGTGAPRRAADVRVVGDRIREVGRLAPRPGERVIDARGRVVAPGFIDTHSHADGGLLDAPEAESQVRQGITTAIIGQDGGSHLPLKAYFESIREKRVALNLASFVGHGTVRGQVMGADFKRAATREEVARMAALVEEEMKSGALGLSTGLEYDPGFYATTEEVIGLARVAGRHGGIYISHIRDEEQETFRWIDELIRIAREARLPAQISHIKLSSAEVWGKAAEALRRIERARREGLEITADVYPYRSWSSTITALVPTRDWEDAALWEKGLADVGGPENVLLATYTPDPAWAGKTIAQIAKQTGRDAVSIVQEVVRRTRVEGAGREGVVVTAMTEEDLRRFIASPHVMFCTDGGLRSRHPRGAGSYPRILGRYVREARVLSLEEAVRKMTSFPATRMGLRDRGRVQPGMKADLVLFNPHTVRDTATPSNPGARPVGLTHVLVNGVPVLDDGRLTGARPGAVLLRAPAGRGSISSSLRRCVRCWPIAAG